MADSKKPLGWGRIFPAARPSVAPTSRRGAWYPVLSQGRSKLVIEIYGTRVALPNNTVEVLPRKPDKFTVVRRRPGEPTPRGAGVGLGRIYAVCPKCSQRLPLYGVPESLQCTGCKHQGVVAWWETA